MLSFIFNILYRLMYVKKGGADMMAMLWAQQIMLGKKTFSQVPAKLKEQVREILIDSGCENLTEE